MKTLDEIIIDIGVYGTACEVGEGFKGRIDMRKAIRADIQALVDASAVKWVRCTMRIPDDSRPVLVSYSHASGEFPECAVAQRLPAKFGVICDYDCWVSDSGNRIDCDGYIVSAWAEIPKPWEGNE